MNFSIAGRSAATQAAGNSAACALWNPHASIHLKVLKVTINFTDLTADFTLTIQRTTTRGTPGSTQSPDGDCNLGGLIAPPSGAVLDLALYSAQPALEIPILVREQSINIERFEWDFSGTPIVIPPGRGLAIATAAAVAIPVSDVVFKWKE